MKSFEEFKNHFKENIAGQLDQIEDKRYYMHNKRLQFGGLTMLMISFSLMLLYLDQINEYGVYFMCIFAPLTSMNYFNNNFQDDTIEEEYKEVVVREMIRFMDNSLRYSPQDFIPLKKWIESGVNPTIPDDYEGDDLIEGSIDGTSLQMSEVMVSHLRPPNNKWYVNKKKKQKEKYKKEFHGFFMIVELDDPPSTEIYIFEDHIQKNWGHVGRLIEQKDDRYGTYVPIKDPEFRKFFKVYATNRADAEKSLKDDFIKRLYKIKKHFKAKVNCVMKEGKLYVFLDVRKELFKVDTTHSLKRSFILKDLYRDMEMILTVAHTLNDPIPEEAPPTQINNNFGDSTKDDHVYENAPVQEEAIVHDSESFLEEEEQFGEDPEEDELDESFAASQEQLFGADGNGKNPHFDLDDFENEDYYEEEDD
ncbi:DUF3137 domain-containing protein [Flammeovirga sp. EKP202]|uniref:DUF3137 domain-containing protein n=1 Tax=Flammeovirga sp. EKP202 TaxID=2770592 RepID=UPI00165F63A3|nr:DUF3137 domain-containing protein [Flammeovirga sp. EKP202]MBD0402661.1 DUF3137 domain-containing protein [Flammeovirga sp. EKP202]